MGKRQFTGYKELGAYYEHLVRSGQLQPGQALPKEPLLAKEHGVTRRTLRRAFAPLVEKGLIVKKRGQGTFVNADINQRIMSPVAVITPEAFGESDLSPSAPTGYAVQLSISSGNYQHLESVTRALGTRARPFGIYYATSDPASVAATLAAIVKAECVGIVVIGIEAEANIESIAQVGPPTVFLDTVVTGAKADFVSARNREGMKEATLHLLATTSGSLAFVGFPASVEGEPQFERFLGFCDAHTEMGRQRDERYHLTTQWLRDGCGRDAVPRILQLSPRPTGIVCSDDTAAFGVIQGLREAGVGVPAEISVVGFANSVYCLMSIPPISSVSPDREEMGRVAVQLLDERIQDPKRAPRHVKTHVKLILRQSTLLSAPSELP